MSCATLGAISLDRSLVNMLIATGELAGIKLDRSQSKLLAGIGEFNTRQLEAVVRIAGI